MSGQLGSLVVSLSADIARFQSDMGKASSTANAHAEKISKSFSSLNTVIGGIGRAFGAATAAFGVSQLVSLADSYTRIEGRLKLVTNSSLELADVQARLQAIAQSSRSEYLATAEVFSRFAQATKGQGVAQEELLSITESLNKAFVISGASTAEANSAMIQLSQGFASGVLRGDEFNSVMEQGGRVIDMLTSYTGKNRGELRAMAEQGEITSDVLRGAFLKGAQAVNDEFERMPTTVGQAGTVLANVLGQLVDDANRATGATMEIAGAIVGLANVIKNKKDGIGSFFASMASGAASASVGVEMLVEAGAAGVDKIEAKVNRTAGLLGQVKELQGQIAAANNNGGKTTGDANLEGLNYQLTQAKRSLADLQSSPFITGEAGGKINIVAEATKKAAFAMQGVRKASEVPTGVSGKAFDEMRASLLPLEVEQEKYQKNLKNIAALEFSGKMTADQASTARLNAAKQLTSYKEREKAEKKAENDAKKSGKRSDTDASSAMRKGEQFYQQTLDKLLPLEKAQRDYNEQLAALEIMDPTRGTDRYKEALGNLTTELQKVEDAHSGVSEARAAAESAISTQQIKLSSKVASGSITGTDALPFEIDLLRQRLKLQQDHLDTIQKTTPQEISAYNSQIEAIEKVNLELVEKERLLRLKDGWEGAKQALSDYGEMAADMGASVSDAVTGAFQGMEDAMVEFVTKGKMDFASLADSILADMARIAVQKSVTGPLSSALGGVISSFLGGAEAATGSTSSEAFAMSLNAKGNVFNSPSLSAYSNRIVSRPTFFAKGGNVMGEAGPEAIMPLQRTSGGELGVKALLGGSGSNVTINVIESSSQAGTQQQRNENGVNIIDVFVAQVKNAVAGDIASGSGAIPGALQRTYGLNRAAGAY